MDEWSVSTTLRGDQVEGALAHATADGWEIFSVVFAGREERDRQDFYIIVARRSQQR
jgi:hypothetical protein